MTQSKQNRFVSVDGDRGDTQLLGDLLRSQPSGEEDAFCTAVFSSNTHEKERRGNLFLILFFHLVPVRFQQLLHLWIDDKYTIRGKAMTDIITFMVRFRGIKVRERSEVSHNRIFVRAKLFQGLF